MNQNKNVSVKPLNVIMLTIAGIINAFGVTVFLAPVKLYDSGISGTGSGLAIRFGGAMDGIEVIAVVFAKRLGFTVGSFVMMYNVILYVICGFIIDSWILPLYSIVTYMAALKTVDYIVEGIDRSKGVSIITSFPDDICKQLSDASEQGITILDAKGYYSNSQKTMIYIVLNRFQITKLKDLVHGIDESAYISINDVADVFKSNHNEN